VPRFVVLEHDWPAPHWDFLLEAGPGLRSWRLLSEPGPDRKVIAERNFDHRLLYLEYEGPLTGNRGIVRRWDAGEFDWVEEGPDRLVVELRGGKLNGRVVIDAATGTWEKT
jgi:hypothetical protein